MAEEEEANGCGVNEIGWFLCNVEKVTDESSWDVIRRFQELRKQASVRAIFLAVRAIYFLPQ